MTFKELEQWLLENNETDQWWLKINDSTLGARVSLSDARLIVSEKPGSKISLLHVSQQTLRPRPWSNIESSTSTPTKTNAEAPSLATDPLSENQRGQPRREQQPPKKRHDPPLKRKKPNASDSIPIQRQIVSASDATYYLRCPSCGTERDVKGKILAERSWVRCRSCREKIKIKERNIVQRTNPSEIIYYHRLAGLFSIKGRIGVKDYWLSNLIMLPVAILVLMAAALTLPRGIVVTFSLFFLSLPFYPLWIRRLHDIGWETIWLLFPLGTTLVMPFLIPALRSAPNNSASNLVSFFPVVSLFTSTWLISMMFFVSGKDKITKHGAPPSKMVIKW